MAANFDKSLSQAPMGMGTDMMPDATGMDIEIEMFEPGALDETEQQEQEPDEFDKNLAEDMDDSVLATVASELVEDFEDDVTSRKDWMQTYVEALDLLAMKIEERTEPWDGACGVIHPMLSEAVVRFQSETMMATFPAAGPVKTTIIGKETPAKKEAAARVQEDMNYQLTEEMPEYRPEHERMLWGLGLAGNAFKKVYYDPHMKRQVSLYVPAEDIVMPYGASNIETAPRVTHVMRKTENEVRRLQIAGFYRDVELGEPMSVLDDIEKKIAERQGFSATSDARYKLLEMQVDYDLPGYEHEDGLKLPYIITIEKHTMKVLSIRRNWKEEDETYAKRQHMVHYGYIPGFGFYCFGLAHLIGAYAKSSTSILRQLVDAGTLANLPGGFKARGMRIKDDDTPIAPGEWKDVDVPSGTIRDNLLPLPYKEPSQVLAALLEKIIEEGRRFANTADLQISDMSAQAPVGTTLAIIERTLKTMSAVQARVHYSMKQELKLLKGIIRDYTPDDYNYDPDTGNRRAKQADYDDVDVIPVSDPNASTMAQKIVQYQASFQLAQTAPQLYNMPLLHREMQEVLGLKNVQKLIPMDEDHKPTDPVSENQNVLMGKPVKAFLTQDHQAHITVHMAAMQDPKIQQLLQMNPQAQALQQAMMAHINEHLGFEYRKQIEQQLGRPLPAQKDEAGEDVPMDPQMEAQLAPMLAQAAQQLLQQNQQQAAAQQAQQQAQDPLVQMQQQELAIKQADQQRKVQKDQADAAAKAEQQQIERERIASQERIHGKDLMVDAIKTIADKASQLHQHGRSSDLDALKHAAALKQQDRHHTDKLDNERQMQMLQERVRARQEQAAKNKPAKKGE